MYMKNLVKESLNLIVSISRQRNGINREILFINWWSENKRSWFNEFLTHHDIIQKGKLFQMVMVSVMGRRWIAEIPFWKPKIFFTAEDTTYRYASYDDYMIRNVDLALGFKYWNQQEKYLRFPLWMIYFLSPDNKHRTNSEGTWYSVDSFMEQLTKRPNFESRTTFMSLVSRHDNRGNGKGLRKKALEAFSQISSVDSAGQFEQNTQILQEKFKNNIEQYLQTCRFNICFENTNAPGYVTEKLFQSLLNGAIPIYWGSFGAVESDILTGNGIITFDPRNPKAAIELVQKIETDVDFREHFLAQPKLKPDAKKNIQKTFEDLEGHFRRIINTH